MGQTTSETFFAWLKTEGHPKIPYCLDGHRTQNISRSVVTLPYLDQELTLTYAGSEQRNVDDLVKVWEEAKSNTCLHPLVLHLCPPVTVEDFGQSVQRSKWEPTIWDPWGIPNGIIIWIIPTSYIYGWGISVTSERAEVLERHRSMIEKIYTQMTSGHDHDWEGSMNPHYEQFFRSLTLSAHQQGEVDHPE
jgi:hypothetical protein